MANATAPASRPACPRAKPVPPKVFIYWRGTEPCDTPSLFVGRLLERTDDFITIDMGRNKKPLVLPTTVGHFRFLFSERAAQYAYKRGIRKCVREYRALIDGIERDAERTHQQPEPVSAYEYFRRWAAKSKK